MHNEPWRKRHEPVNKVIILLAPNAWVGPALWFETLAGECFREVRDTHDIQAVAEELFVGCPDIEGDTEGLRGVYASNEAVRGWA